MRWLSDVYHGRQHHKLQYLMSVCTGSALLAKSGTQQAGSWQHVRNILLQPWWVHAGLLDERAATSNNRAFDWVRSQSETTIWVKRARWVEVISTLVAHHPSMCLPCGIALSRDVASILTCQIKLTTYHVHLYTHTCLLHMSKCQCENIV